MKDLLTRNYYHNPASDWLLAAGLAVGVVLVLHLVKVFLISRLKHSVTKTETLIDDTILDLLRRTAVFFELAMGVFVAANYALDLPPTPDARLRTAVTLACLLQAGLWGNVLVRYFIIGFVDRRAEPGDVAHNTGKIMLRFVGMSLVWSAAGLLILENIGISVSTLIAGLGVTGVAVGFAAQNILGDLFASIAILLDKPFLVGDAINCDTFTGTVERIGIKTTRLRSVSGEIIIIANSDLSKSRVRNFKHLKERRIVFAFSVKYETPVEQLAAVGGLCKEIISGLDNTRFDRAHMLGLGDSGAQYEVVYFVTVADYALYCTLQERINLQLMQALAKRRIELAYHTVVSHNFTHMIPPESGRPTSGMAA